MTEARTHQRDELHVGLRAEFEREVREEDKHQNERWYRMQSALVPLGRVCRAEDVSDVVAHRPQSRTPAVRRLLLHDPRLVPVLPSARRRR